MVKEDESERFVPGSELYESFMSMQADLDALHKQSLSIIQKLGLKPSVLRKFSRDRRNFSEEEWEMLVEAKKQATQFKREMWDALDFKVKKRKKKNQSKEAKAKVLKRKKQLQKKQALKKGEGKKSSRRKKRFVGVKKGWMRLD